MVTDLTASVSSESISVLLLMGSHMSATFMTWWTWLVLCSATSPCFYRNPQKQILITYLGYVGIPEEGSFAFWFCIIMRQLITMQLGDISFIYNNFWVFFLFDVHVSLLDASLIVPEGPSQYRCKQKLNNLKSLMHQTKSKENWTNCFLVIECFLINCRSYFSIIFFLLELSLGEKGKKFSYGTMIVSLIVLEKKIKQFLWQRL